MQATVYGPPHTDALLAHLEYTSDAYSHIGLGVRIQMGGASPSQGDRSVKPGPEPVDPLARQIANPRPPTSARRHDAAIPRRVARTQDAARFVS